MAKTATIRIAFSNFNYLASFRCKLHCACKITRTTTFLSSSLDVLGGNVQPGPWETARPRAASSAPDATRHRGSNRARRATHDDKHDAGSGSKSRFNDYRRTLIHQLEKFHHVFIPHTHTTMTRGRADLVFVFRAVNIDEPVARIRIVLIQSVQP